MKLRRLTTVVAAATLAAAIAVPAASASSTSAEKAPAVGSRSLAEVLTSDGDQFDTNSNDYDVLTEAVLAVLAAKPDSPVAVLTDGSVRLTAFLPDDYAFQELAYALTGTRITSESELFTTLATALGIDTIESVLLYHVIPGATIKSWTALQSDGLKLATALPDATLRVDVLSRRSRIVALSDADRNYRNAVIDPQAFNINRGNRQIAHGITLVLRPLDI